MQPTNELRWVDRRSWNSDNGIPVAMTVIRVLQQKWEYGTDEDYKCEWRDVPLEKEE